MNEQEPRMAFPARMEAAVNSRFRKTASHSLLIAVPGHTHFAPDC